MERIKNKTQAKKLFDAGVEVYAMPCKLNPASPWNTPMLIRNDISTWDNQLATIEYYNCNAETGRYLAFYRRAM